MSYLLRMILFHSLQYGHYQGNNGLFISSDFEKNTIEKLSRLVNADYKGIC